MKKEKNQNLSEADINELQQTTKLEVTNPNLPINNDKIEEVDIGVDRHEIDETFNIKGENQNHRNLAMRLLQQNLNVNQNIDKNLNYQKQSDMNLATMKNISPQDSIEAMLATQMMAIHNSTMEALRDSNRLMKNNDYQNSALGLKQLNVANKLSRTYTMQMEALSRYRGKGQQKITVEHININEGGKAVIGNISNAKAEVSNK